MGQLKPLLLRIDETAALLGVGRTKVYELIRAGTLSTVRLAGDMRVPRAAVVRPVADAMKPAKEAEPVTLAEPMVPPDLSGLHRGTYGA
jgi:excisionase family DNA binding protein